MQQGKQNKEKPLPSTALFSICRHEVCDSCPYYLLAAGLLRVIALQGSLMQREETMEWAKEHVSSFELSLAVARTVCCRCCESEQTWRREAVSAHQHGWVQIFVLYCQTANSMAFRESQAFSRHTEGRILCFAEMILQSDFKLKGQLILQ